LLRSKCNGFSGMMIHPQPLLLPSESADDKRVLEYFGNSRDMRARTADENKESMTLVLKGFDGKDTKYVHELTKENGHPKVLVSKLDEVALKKFGEMNKNFHVYKQLEAHYKMNGKSCQVQRLGMRNEGETLHVSYDRDLCAKIKPMVKKMDGVGKLNQCAMSLSAIRDEIAKYNASHKADKMEAATGIMTSDLPIEPKKKSWNLTEEMRAILLATNCFGVEMNYDKDPKTLQEGMPYAAGGIGLGFGMGGMKGPETGNKDEADTAK
jgi:hypothetical protein